MEFENISPALQIKEVYSAHPFWTREVVNFWSMSKLSIALLQESFQHEIFCHSTTSEPEGIQEMIPDVYIISERKSLGHVWLFATSWTVAHKESGAIPFLGDFLIQGSNPGLLNYRQIHYCLSHWGSP